MAVELNVEDMMKVFLSGDDDTDYEEKDDSDIERESSDYGENKDDTDSEDLVIPCEDVEVQTLETLCLRSITKNFKRFNIAYNTSKDSIMQKHLLFLQRVYADHMISEAPVDIKDSYLDFLLNEYLTELNLELLHECSDKALLNKISKIGSCFIKANLKCMPSAYFKFDGPSLVQQVVKFLPNLCVLNVQSVCNDEILQNIASSCPKLQELYIDESSVSNQGVRCLIKRIDDTFQPCCQLTVLSLTNTHVESCGLEFLLRYMPSLQQLNHSYVPLVLCSLHQEDTEKGVSVQKYNLTSLDLIKQNLVSHMDLSNVLTVCTFVCPHVTKLSTHIENEEHLGLLPLFTELEDLTVEFFHTIVDTLNMDNYLKFHGGKLKKLHLNCFSLSVPTFLEGCPKLEELVMRDVDFLWDDKYTTSNPPPFNCLRKIYLENFIFEDRAIEMSMALLLNHCPKVEVLEIAHCELTDSKIHEALSNFCAKSVVKSLHFRCCDVRSGLLESILLTCSSLRSLSINDCDNILSDHFDNLCHIIQSKNQKVDMEYSDPRSELNSINDEFFDHYDFSDDSDDDYYNYGYGYSTPYDYEDDIDYGSDF